jgi:hypothetical protein
MAEGIEVHLALRIFCCTLVLTTKRLSVVYTESFLVISAMNFLLVLCQTKYCKNSTR